MLSGLTVISLGLIAFFISRKMKWIGGEESNKETETNTSTYAAAE